MNYWYKPEEDAPPVMFKTEASVPKDWIHVPGDYNVMTGQWEDAEPIAKRAVDDARAPLRAAYFEKFGKKPYMGWSAATLREKLG